MSTIVSALLTWLSEHPHVCRCVSLSVFLVGAVIGWLFTAAGR